MGLDIRFGSALSGPSQCITVASNSFPDCWNCRAPVCSGLENSMLLLVAAVGSSYPKKNWPHKWPPYCAAVSPKYGSSPGDQMILICAHRRLKLSPPFDLPLCHYLHPCQYNDASPILIEQIRSGVQFWFRVPQLPRSRRLANYSEHCFTLEIELLRRRTGLRIPQWASGVRQSR
jgi:hypothetical protein